MKSTQPEEFDLGNPPVTARARHLPPGRLLHKDNALQPLIANTLADRAPTCTFRPRREAQHIRLLIATVDVIVRRRRRCATRATDAAPLQPIAVATGWRFKAYNNIEISQLQRHWT